MAAVFTGSVLYPDGRRCAENRGTHTVFTSVLPTEPVKTAAMLAYRIPVADRKRTELDHLVPLELGGSNDVSNLWPQISDLSLVDERNSKDAVELRVWRAVCRDRKVGLVLAQEAFARDWTSAEKFLGLSPA